MRPCNWHVERAIHPRSSNCGDIFYVLKYALYPSLRLLSESDQIDVVTVMKKLVLLTALREIFPIAYISMVYTRNKILITALLMPSLAVIIFHFTSSHLYVNPDTIRNVLRRIFCLASY